MHKYEELYQDFKFLALVPAKIATNLGILVAILLLLIADIDFGQNSDAGWNVWDISWAVLLIILGLIVVKWLANIQEYPKYYRQDYEQLGYNFQESKKLTRYLQRLLKSKVDSSKYSSANRQNQLENNLIRLGSFVICFRQSIYIFILRTGGIDGRRDISELNEIARELANFTDARNSSFQQFTTEYKPPLMINRRLVNYVVQRLDR